MKAGHLGALIAAAVLALIAAFWATNLREPDTTEINAALFPGLAEAVNDVTVLRLIGPENRAIATLTRGEQNWLLTQKAGHPANIAHVRELLLQLSRAKLLEEKTSNPEYYQRLGVEAIDSADAGGVLVEIDGVDVPAVIIGDVVPAREAVYARRVDEPGSWLVSGSISINDDLLHWLDRDVIDINSSRIAEVQINHPDAEVVLISKAVFGQANFDVANVPTGRELKRANIANAMASVVEGLKADDVLPAEGSGFAELEKTTVTYRAFDGYVLHADVATKDDKYYVQFSAGTDATIAARYLPGATGDATQVEADLSVVMQEAEKQNQASAGWVYTLPKYEYDQMTRRMSDLLQDPA